jgi:hypothetical protein
VTAATGGGACAASGTASAAPPGVQNGSAVMIV